MPSAWPSKLNAAGILAGLIAAFFLSSFPARRATRVDPVTSLRYE